MDINNYEIKVQAVDNGFVIRADPQKQGVPAKKLIATGPEDLQTKLKDIIDHMFDEPPVKESKTKIQGKSQILTGGPQ